MLRHTLLAALLAATSTAAFAAPETLAENTATATAEDNDPRGKRRHRPRTVINIVKEIRIKKTPGAVAVVDKKEMQTYQRTDIHRALKTVPGVNVQEEDGFGLRPNIGVRGSRVNRSADITLMEDGILIAPAPYVAPDAYYFPRVERMDRVEVIKGAGNILYGPRTTNGAVNLVSAAIPETTSGHVSAAYGTDNTQKYSLRAGDSAENIGFVLDTNRISSDGFKRIDGGGPTDFYINDAMGKLRLNTDPKEEHYQEFEFKIGATDEVSNETYLGLTNDDFSANPYRRYAASRNDQMDSTHSQYSLRHSIDATEDLTISSAIYRNVFDRNWGRINSVGSTSIATIVNNPTANAALLDILRGTADSASGQLVYRNNNRSYLSEGLQTQADWDVATGSIKHHVIGGIRLHRDHEDRFQDEDRYTMQGGQLLLATDGAPGSNANLIAEGEGIALFAQDTLDFGRLELSPGIRYETITLSRDNYGSADPTRSGASLQRFEGDVNAWTAGIGASFELTPEWQLIAGVHEGFAPPGVPTTQAEADNLRPEESMAYEAGVRYQKGYLNAELIGFYTDYDHLLGRDTFSSGGGGSNDTFAGGQAEVKGIEALAKYDLAALTGQSEYRFPVTASYTYTSAEFTNTFSSSFAEWGNVQSGFELPYVAPHQAALTLGVETDEWLVSLTGKYTDQMRTVAGMGPLDPLQSTDANFVLDAAAEYEILPQTRAFMVANNLTDETYIAARRPAGVRPGMPLMVLAGVRYNF